jgi:hypothetical protein
MSGNGDHRLKARQSPLFKYQRVHLEDRWPRLREVFAQVIRQLEVLPRHNAGQAGATVWLYITKEGADAPPLWIYYEIGPREVVLQSVLARGKEQFVL